MENTTNLVAIHLTDGSTYLTSVDVESSIYTSLMEGLHPDNKFYKFPAGKWVEDLNTSKTCIYCEYIFLRAIDISRIQGDPYVSHASKEIRMLVMKKSKS